MNSMRLTAVFFASILPEMVCQIATSSDLNCGFEGTCRWRNASIGEDSGDFLITNNIKMEGHFNIIPSKNVPEEVFAYTKGLFDGAQKAILISDVISCQLGGGSLTIWYYRTGESAALEVCIRQPPGSMNTADLRCFPVFSQSLANQWLFHTVDFPPLTQPFELLISSSFVQPFDIIAIDDIYYDAALCGSSKKRIIGKLSSNNISSIFNEYQRARFRRDNTYESEFESHTGRSTGLFSNLSSSNSTLISPPALIGYFDWKILNKSTTAKHPIMLVVAQEEEESAAVFQRNSREIPLKVTLSLTNVSGIVKTTKKNTGVTVNQSPHLDPFKKYMTAANHSRIRAEESVIASSTALGQTEKMKTDLKSYNETYDAQHTFETFLQKFTPLIFSALASILKSSDIYKELQGINSNIDNAKLVGEFLMTMRPEEQKLENVTGRSFSTIKGSKGLKIDKIQKNMYGMPRKIHAEFGLKSAISDSDDPKSVRRVAGVEHVNKQDHSAEGEADNIIDAKKIVALNNAEIEVLHDIQKKLSDEDEKLENVNSRSTEGAGGKFALLSDTEDGLLGNIVDGIGLVDKNTIPQFINQNRTRSLLPLYASPGSRRPAVKLQRGRTSATWAPRCLFTDCSFDAVSMCLYKSTEQLQDDEDLLLDLPSHSVLKKWELSNHKVGNSLTGIMGDFNGDGWFAYAGKTKNPATMFLMHTSQAVFIPEESKIDFLLHMAGKYGRLRVCLDSLQKCPFKRTGQQLSIKTRTWTNFHLNISRGFHTIYFVADHLKKNYVIGLDEIRLLNRYGNASAPCM